MDISIFYVINRFGFICVYTTSLNSVCIHIESRHVWRPHEIPRDGPRFVDSGSELAIGLLQAESRRITMCSHQNPHRPQIVPKNIKEPNVDSNRSLCVARKSKYNTVVIPSVAIWNPNSWQQWRERGNKKIRLLCLTYRFF